MNLYAISHDFEKELDAFDELLNLEWEHSPDGDYFITEDGEYITPADYTEALENRFTALDNMEQDVQKKAVNVAAFIANASAEIEAMKQRERALSARRKSKENTVQSLKRYLMNCMEAASLKKIDSPELCISVRNNAESVSIPDEKAFINWAQEHDRDDLLKFAEPTINKTAVKNCLKDGAKLPFAGLLRTQSVIIK